MSTDTTALDAVNCEDSPAPAVAGSSRIGLIVPSSNTTMETEVPALLRARERARPEGTFSFHSARLRMEDVTPDALRAVAKLA